jgi:hypothetical protein
MSAEFDCSVLTLYSPSGGKAARHGWTAASAHIGAISYLVVQTFAQVFGCRFKAIHGPNQRLGTLSFAHISSDAVFTALSERIESTGFLEPEISLHSAELFNQLQGHLDAVAGARKELSKRRRTDK